MGIQGYYEVNGSRRSLKVDGLKYFYSRGFVFVFVFKISGIRPPGVQSVNVARPKTTQKYRSFCRWITKTNNKTLSSSSSEL